MDICVLEWPGCHQSPCHVNPMFMGWPHRLLKCSYRIRKKLFWNYLYFAGKSNWGNVCFISSWRSHCSLLPILTERSSPTEGMAEAHGTQELKVSLLFCSQASIKPKCGRMISFSSGGENPHGVKAVTRGQRCAVALWFTLDPLYRELVSPHPAFWIDHYVKSFTWSLRLYWLL